MVSCDPVMVTAYSDAITVAHGLKGFKTKAEHPTRLVKAGSNRLMFDLPLSGRWEWKGAKGDFGKIIQRDRLELRAR